MKCADCGYRASMAIVAMFDYCPACYTTPFNEDTQEDAQASR